MTMNVYYSHRHHHVSVASFVLGAILVQWLAVGGKRATPLRMLFPPADVVAAFRPTAVTTTANIAFVGSHRSRHRLRNDNELVLQKGTQMQALKEPTEKKAGTSGAFDWMDQLRDWWEAEVLHHDVQNKEEQEVERDDAWVAEEFNKVAEVEEEVEPVELETKPEPTTASVKDDKLEEVLKVEPAPEKKKEVKERDARFDWSSIVDGLFKVGTGEKQKEKDDAVVEDMIQTGKKGRIDGDNEDRRTVVADADWIARDMEDAGDESRHHHKLIKPEKTRADKKKKTKNEWIEDDMVKAGKLGEDDDNDDEVRRIARNMAATGSSVARDEELEQNVRSNKLTETLKKQHEKAYDDVYDDMKKQGKRVGVDASKDQLIAEEMRRTGKADNGGSRVFHKDESYELNKELKKSFGGADKIREEMETAGRAQDQDWIKHDLETASGRRSVKDSVLGRKLPDQDKDLVDAIHPKDEERWIANDMTAEGRAASKSRHEKGLGRTTNPRAFEKLVADDLAKTGTSSSSWVESDMERLGQSHAATAVPGSSSSHMQRETQEVMSTRHAGHLAATPPFGVKPQQEGEEEADASIQDAHEDRLHHYAHNLVRALKKTVMPWKKWSDL